MAEADTSGAPLLLLGIDDFRDAAGAYGCRGHLAAKVQK
jgi:hypothetical protein